MGNLLLGVLIGFVGYPVLIALVKKLVAIVTGN